MDCASYSLTYLHELVCIVGFHNTKKTKTAAVFLKLFTVTARIDKHPETQ